MQKRGELYYGDPSSGGHVAVLVLRVDNHARGDFSFFFVINVLPVHSQPWHTWGNKTEPKFAVETDAESAHTPCIRHKVVVRSKPRESTHRDMRTSSRLAGQREREKTAFHRQPSSSFTPAIIATTLEYTHT